jgi:hypothetical protein
MSIIYALVGTNRVLRHSNSNNQIVIGDFNSFRFFWDTLYSDEQKSTFNNIHTTIVFRDKNSIV